MADKIVAQMASAGEEAKAVWIAPIVSKVQAGDAEGPNNATSDLDGTGS